MQFPFLKEKLSTAFSTKPIKQTVTKSDFNFLYVIGKGGFGRVWKVQSKKTSKIYALKEMSKLKILDKHSEKSINSELLFLSKLHNSFIVNMHYAFQDNSTLYLVIDMLSGGDLRYHISRYRRFSEEQTRFFIACIIQGLSYIHKNNVIHRDIKPENLVLDQNGYVCITDFGIAKENTKDNSSETSGTPGYMAPEVLIGKNHSFPADLFAVGVMGYEFMIGKRPYNGRNRKEIKEIMMSKQAKIDKDNLISGWSNESADFINGLLIRKPSNRLGQSGINELIEHPWIKYYPWKELENKTLKAPFIPENKDNFDKRYCESVEVLTEGTKIRYEELMMDEKYHSAFANFYFYGEEKSVKNISCNKDKKEITEIKGNTGHQEIKDTKDKRNSLFMEKSINYTDKENKNTNSFTNNTKEQNVCKESICCLNNINRSLINKSFSINSINKNTNINCNNINSSNLCIEDNKNDSLPKNAQNNFNYSKLANFNSINNNPHNYFRINIPYNKISKDKFKKLKNNSISAVTNMNSNMTSNINSNMNSNVVSNSNIIPKPQKSNNTNNLSLISLSSRRNYYNKKLTNYISNNSINNNSHQLSINSNRNSNSLKSNSKPCHRKTLSHSFSNAKMIIKNDSNLIKKKYISKKSISYKQELEPFNKKRTNNSYSKYQPSTKFSSDVSSFEHSSKKVENENNNSINNRNYDIQKINIYYNCNSSGISNVKSNSINKNIIKGRHSNSLSRLEKFVKGKSSLKENYNSANVSFSKNTKGVKVNSSRQKHRIKKNDNTINFIPFIKPKHINFAEKMKPSIDFIIKKIKMIDGFNTGHNSSCNKYKGVKI